MEDIRSLEELIQRLKDPKGGSVLHLSQKNLGDMTVGFSDIDDFASVYCEFLTAIKANTTITKLEYERKGWDASNRGTYPIINPLLKHLPSADTACIELRDSVQSSFDGVLHQLTTSFRTVHVKDMTEDDDDDEDDEDFEVIPDLCFDPNLEVFHYDNEARSPANGAIGYVVQSLPFPSRLVDLRLSVENNPWVDRFSKPELQRLVEIVQEPSLMKLSLKGLFFSKNNCKRFARGLAGSSVKDLQLELCTSASDNYRPIIDALTIMPDLHELALVLCLDGSTNDETSKSYSIPAGALAVTSANLSSLMFIQGWKPLDSSQCQDLALAIQAPTCRMKEICLHAMTMSDLGTVMSSFSVPSSSIERFEVHVTPFCEEDVDTLLSLLPMRTCIQSCFISFNSKGRLFSESQSQKFLEIVSGWYCLDHMFGKFIDTCLDEDSRAQIESLCRLNKAGRRYLISPSRSHAAGVEVLVQVRDNLNDVFSHILENPSLCDRQPVLPPSREVRQATEDDEVKDNGDTSNTNFSEPREPGQNPASSRLFAKTKELIDARDDKNPKLQGRIDKLDLEYERNIQKDNRLVAFCQELGDERRKLIDELVAEQQQLLAEQQQLIDKCASNQDSDEALG